MTLFVGPRPSDKGQYEWVFSFLVVGRRPIKLPSATPMARGLKKKTQQAMSPSRHHKTGDLSTHTSAVYYVHRLAAAVPFAGGCVFYSLSLIFLDGTEKY